MSIPKEVKAEIINDPVKGWIAETWKVALFTSASNCLTKSLYSDCSGEVSATGTGYVTGGAIVNKSAWGAGSNYVDTTNAMIDATDTQWTAVTFTARYAVVYNTVTSKIRCVKDFVSDKTVTGGTFIIQWNAGGIIKIS